ncbi:hypothetical protein IWX90DRAFT_175481 [Phyllosticta citrichinensis]|uniref:Uncharacterized protein n=1 Tax=Phyllosticta citrichinensis TaxID=1130410 RepID=A0ABR1XVB7_9PEZI
MMTARLAPSPEHAPTMVDFRDGRTEDRPGGSLTRHSLPTVQFQLGAPRHDHARPDKTRQDQTRPPLMQPRCRTTRPAASRLSNGHGAACPVGSPSRPWVVSPWLHTPLLSPDRLTGWLPPMTTCKCHGRSAYGFGLCRWGLSVACALPDTPWPHCRQAPYSHGLQSHSSPPRPSWSASMWRLPSNGVPAGDVCLTPCLARVLRPE